MLLEEVKKPRLGNNIDFFHINLAFFSEAVGTCPQLLHINVKNMKLSNSVTLYNMHEDEVYFPVVTVKLAA